MSDRKVVLKMVVSLDGFVTSPDGTHEWMFEWFGDDSGEWNRRALEEAGVHAMGRRSYEIMGPHWAASEGPIATESCFIACATNQEQFDSHGGEAGSPRECAMS